MSATPSTSDGVFGELADSGAGASVGPGASTSRWRLSPAGAAILAATVLGLGLRMFLLTRPGFLTSGTVEYDDGVYLGAALRFVHGALPYRDFAFVQPPGILILSLPAALVGSMTSPAAGLAVARVLTVCASAACIPLAGNLVRYRGVLVTTVTCGLLAVFPAHVLALGPVYAKTFPLTSMTANWRPSLLQPCGSGFGSSARTFFTVSSALIPCRSATRACGP